MYTLEHIAQTMNSFHNLIGHEVIENVTGKPPVFVNAKTLNQYIFYLRRGVIGSESIEDTFKLNEMLYNAASPKRQRRAKRYYELYNKMFEYIRKVVYKNS